MKKFKLMEDDTKKRGDTGIIIDDGILIDVGMDIENLVVPSGTVEIDANVVCDHHHLKTVTLPDSVLKIQESAFKNCTDLTEVNFGNKLDVIGINAFNHCTKLHTLTIPDSVTAIGPSAFQCCFELNTIELGKSIQFIGTHAFINTMVENIYYAGSPEEWCQIKYATPFFPYGRPYCLVAKGKEITEFAPANGLTTIEAGAFRTCGSLEKVVLPNSVTDIGEAAFAHCSQLKTVKFGNGIRVLNKDLFYSCLNLTEVYLPSSLGSISQRVFAFCSNLDTIIYDGDKTQWHKIKRNSTWKSTTPLTVKCTDGNIRYS